MQEKVLKDRHVATDDSEMDIESSHQDPNIHIKKSIADDSNSADFSQLQKRSVIFILLFLALFAARIGQGIIPAITTNLAEYFSMKSLAIGSLGSMVYFGCTIGSAIAVPYLDFVPPRMALLICLAVQILSLLAFTYVHAWNQLAAARLVSGACQVILAIYLPVWVDAFAPSDKKTTWMTLNIMASPLGQLTGYGIAAVVVTFAMGWWWAFYIVCVIMVASMVGLSFIPNSEIDIKELLKNQNSGETKPSQQVTDASDDVRDDDGRAQPPAQQDNYKRLQERLIEIESEKTKDFGFWKRLRYILTRLDFMILMSCLTCLFVVVTGIQFWMTDYLISVMGATQSDAYKFYFMCGAVGPVGGIVACGAVFDRFGGYLDRKAIPICCGVGLLSCIFAMISVCIDQGAFMVAFTVMLELFGGAFVMPAMTGIMLNQVPPKMRTMANSVANFSYNMFGYLPAPTLYGFFYEMGGAGKSHLGLFVIQIFTAIACFFMAWAMIRNRALIKKYEHVTDFASLEQEGLGCDSKSAEASLSLNEASDETQESEQNQNV